MSDNDAVELLQSDWNALQQQQHAWELNILLLDPESPGRPAWRRTSRDLHVHLMRFMQGLVVSCKFILFYDEAGFHQLGYSHSDTERYNKISYCFSHVVMLF